MTSPTRQTYTFTGNDGLSPIFGRMAVAGERLERKLDDLGDEARELGRDFTVAERATARLGDELGDASREADKLERSLKSVGKQHGILGRLMRSGGGGGGIPDLPGGGAAAGGGAGGRGLFGAALGSPLMPAAIGMGAIALPMIGAMIGGAILAALGGGALATGIASAVRDPAVKEAFKPLGKDFADLFTEAGGPFKAPLRMAAMTLRKDLGNIRQEWVTGIGGMASLVTPLTKGISGLFQETSPGFLRALEAAGPVVRVIAQELPGLGRDLSNMFDSLADGSEGAAEGMRLLINVGGDLLRFAGQTIEVLSKVEDKMSDLAAEDKVLAANLFGWWAPWLSEANTGTQYIKTLGVTAAGAFELMGDAAKTARVPLSELDRKLEDIVETGQNMRLATLDVRDALAEFKKAADENGRTLDINSEKGRANLRVIEAGIQAAINAGNAARDRALAEGKSADAAEVAGAQIRETWIKELEKSAAAAGYNKKQIAEMVAEAKRADGVTIRTFYTNIHSTLYRSITDKSEAAALILGRRQHGGPVQPGHAYVVGEEGPEILQMGNQGGYVHPNGRGPAGPAELTLRIVHQYPDGKVIVEQVQKVALQSGRPSLSSVFAMPA